MKTFLSVVWFTYSWYNIKRNRERKKTLLCHKLLFAFFFNTERIEYIGATKLSHANEFGPLSIYENIFKYRNIAFMIVVLEYSTTFKLILYITIFGLLTRQWWTILRHTSRREWVNSILLSVTCLYVMIPQENTLIQLTLKDLHHYQMSL